MYPTDEFTISQEGHILGGGVVPKLIFPEFIFFKNIYHLVLCDFLIVP